jgi:enoyl-CoA hydratase/carnithine racemase
MWRGLADHFTGLGQAPDAGDRAHGGREHFCADADIGEFGDGRATSADATAYEHAVDACLEAIGASPRPTIAAVAGYCLGGGVGLAAACDFRVASPTACSGFPRWASGSSTASWRPATSWRSWTGAGQAYPPLGPSLRRRRGVRQGLVDEVAGDPLGAVVTAFAAPMADNAPLCMAAPSWPGDPGRRVCAGSVALIERTPRDAAASHEYREDVRAFLEKRRPAFTGC